MYTSSSTPPLPLRNPTRSRLYPIPQLPQPPISPELIPPPLFSKRNRLPPTAIPVTIVDIPDLSPPSDTNSTSSSTPSSPRSIFSSASTAPTSVPGSPSFRARALTYSSSPSLVWQPHHWDPIPTQSLRRKQSPKRETLRSLRAKQSDACLQRIYEQQTLSYLDGSVLGLSKRMGMIRLDEEDLSE